MINAVGAAARQRRATGQQGQQQMLIAPMFQQPFFCRNPDRARAGAPAEQGAAGKRRFWRRWPEQHHLDAGRVSGRLLIRLPSHPVIKMEQDPRIIKEGWSYAKFVRDNPTAAHTLASLLQYSGFFAPVRESRTQHQDYCCCCCCCTVLAERRS